MSQSLVEAMMGRESVADIKKLVDEGADLEGKDWDGGFDDDGWDDGEMRWVAAPSKKLPNTDYTWRFCST